MTDGTYDKKQVKGGAGLPPLAPLSAPLPPSVCTPRLAFACGCLGCNAPPHPPPFLLLALQFKILDMEALVLATLKFNVTVCTIHSFMIRYLKAAHADQYVPHTHPLP